MARIQYVKAWGLWSHYESVFNFAPGLTVITGPNGSGKSGFISIIRWVFLGEPAGEDFIFTIRDEKTQEIIRQAEEGKAEVGLDNGIVITKTRRKGKTTYTINTVADVFEKAEVPQEIRDALGLQVYKFGDWETYLNFAFQLEAPFLISESPSVGAKVLGKLAGTEAVDLAIAAEAKKAYAAREEKRLGEKDIETKNGDLLAYQDIDDIKAQLDACEFLMAEVEKAAAKRDNIKDLDHKLYTAQEAIKTLSEELIALAIVPDIDVDLKAIEKAQQRYDTLLGLFNQLGSEIARINTLTDQLALYEGVGAATSILNDLEAKERRLTEYSNLKAKHENYTTDIESLEVFLKTTKDLDVAAADLAVYEKKATKLENLTALFKELYLKASQVAALDDALEELKDIGQAAQQLKAIDLKAGKLADLQQIQKEFNVKNILAQQAVKDLADAETKYKQAEEELRAAWEAAGGICPLCDQPIATHSHE